MLEEVDAVIQLFVVEAEAVKSWKFYWATAFIYARRERKLPHRHFQNFQNISIFDQIHLGPG